MITVCSAEGSAAGRPCVAAHGDLDAAIVHCALGVDHGPRATVRSPIVAL